MVYAVRVCIEGSTVVCWALATDLRWRNPIAVLVHIFQFDADIYQSRCVFLCAVTVLN